MTYFKPGSEPLFFDWAPVPRWPWTVRRRGAFVVRSFADSRSGLAWLKKKGYALAPND